MKELYADYVKDELWLIKENEFVRGLQGIREAQFALGNGYLGTRGICEEIPYDCIPGTYIAGLYDEMAAQVSDLVNLPNPVNFKFTIEGEKFDAVAMDISEHKRVLNTKKGLLARKTLYKDSKKKRYDYQSIRFISQHNKNIGVMQIAFTPLDAGCVLDINTGIDTSVSNVGILSEGRKKHFRIRELGQYRKAGCVVLETFEKKYTVVYWAGFYYHLAGKKTVAKDNIFRLKLKKNQTVVFTKVFCIKHFPHRDSHALHKKKALALFQKAFKSSFSTLLKQHIGSWDKLWKRADVVIEGTANIQQNMRFNIYHMLICLHCDNGLSSIGARTLSGEGYRGHVFWDAEIFLLPFYLFTFPKVAKNMLLYRYRRLDAARKIAKENGFKGAQFAWESGDTGEEETPEWARNIDRTIIKIHTHRLEHHITADVAYAVYQYYLATGDENFMSQYGYELFMETARFWASRVEYNKRTKKYGIKHVIGPDEFHVDVNNNAFTNMMARWNLLTAVKLFTHFKKAAKTRKNLSSKLNVSEKEVHSWKKIASGMVIHINKHKIVEQFDGFFKLKKVILNKTDENGIPIMPGQIKAKDLGKTQIVKQADVLMLMCLLGDTFSLDTKTVNYDFYVPRTAHKSSLSIPAHALIASTVGDLHRAYNLFNVSLRTDISNLYGNTAEGIHAASLGGTWQALIFGFGGIRIKKGELFIDPCMPHSWKKLVFSLVWRENVIRMELTNSAVKFKVIAARGKNIKIGVFDKLFTLKTNKVHIFKRATHEVREEEYY